MFGMLLAFHAAQRTLLLKTNLFYMLSFYLADVFEIML